ncbi:hypothetical protein J6590_060766 [Homalodisca vitripennis]|nr:hypothetical protein J6590_060766 [Homalodisca vitripennis]
MKISMMLGEETRYCQEMTPYLQDDRGTSSDLRFGRSQSKANPEPWWPKVVFSPSLAIYR